MGHGDVLLVLQSPNSFPERFGAGARPVHPILGSHNRNVLLLGEERKSRLRHLTSKAGPQTDIDFPGRDQPGSGSPRTDNGRWFSSRGYWWAGSLAPD